MEKGVGRLLALRKWQIKIFLTLNSIVYFILSKGPVDTNKCSHKLYFNYFTF